MFSDTRHLATSSKEQPPPSLGVQVPEDGTHPGGGSAVFGGAAGGVLWSAGGQRGGENQHLQDADRRREHHGRGGLRQREQVGGENASFSVSLLNL